MRLSLETLQLTCSFVPVRIPSNPNQGTRTAVPGVPAADTRLGTWKKAAVPPRHPPAPAGPVLPPASRQAAAFSQATFRVSSNCPLPVIKSFKLIGRFSTTSETTTSLPRAAKRLLTPLPFGSRGKEAKRRCRQQPMRNFASPGLGDAQHPNWAVTEGTATAQPLSNWTARSRVRREKLGTRVAICYRQTHGNTAPLLNWKAHRAHHLWATAAPRAFPLRTPRLATTSRIPSTPQLLADGVGRLSGAASRAEDNQREVAEPRGEQGPPRTTPHGGGRGRPGRPSLSPPPARPRPPAPLCEQLTCRRRHAPPSHGPRPRALLPARRTRRASAAPARRPLPSAFGHAQSPSRLLAEPTTEGRGVGKGGEPRRNRGQSWMLPRGWAKNRRRRKEQLELKGAEAASLAGRRAASRCADPPLAVWDAPQCLGSRAEAGLWGSAVPEPLSLVPAYGRGSALAPRGPGGLSGASAQRPPGTARPSATTPAGRRFRTSGLESAGENTSLFSCRISRGLHPVRFLWMGLRLTLGL